MKFKLTSILAIVLLLFVANCSNPEDGTTSTETGDNTYGQFEIVDTCDCQSAWFNGSTILAPKEGPESVFADSSTTNCMFQQWSWQKFLYLTQEDAASGLPYFMTGLTQVNSKMDTIYRQGDAMVLSENTQAGGNGLLTSNKTYGQSGTTEMVYYSIHLTDEFLTAAYGFQQMIADHPDSVNNSQTFPVGSVELKAAWVNVDGLPSGTTDYFTTSALINGEPVTVALLGMHVVGVVENHPEFVWGTFEHYNLAPHYDWLSTTSEDIPVTSQTNLPLFDVNDSADLTDIEWTYGDTIPRDPNNVFSVYRYGTPQMSGGGYLPGTSQNGGENFANIAQLNQSVLDTLTKKGINLWTNYFLDGAIWMNMDNLSHAQQVAVILDPTRVNSNDYGNADTLGPLRGSLAAANISMETYEQLKSTSAIHSSGIANLMNCFVCHTPKSYLEIEGTNNAISPTYLSHVFMDYMSYQKSTLSMKAYRADRIKKFTNYLRSK